MSIFDALEDMFDEDAKYDRAFEEGVADGEAALELEELQEMYDVGFDVGHGDFDFDDD